jgi:hypothetical protein
MGGQGRGDPGLQFQYEFNTVLFPVEPGVTSYVVKSTDDQILAPATMPAGAFTINLMGQQSGPPPVFDGQHIYIGDPLGKLSPGTSFHVVGRSGGVGKKIAAGGVPVDFVDLTVAGTEIALIYSAFTDTWNVFDGGPGGGSVIPVATDVPNVAALTALPSAGYRVGARVNVDTLLVPFQLDPTSTATPDGITVANTNTGIGRWLRVPLAVPRWSAEPFWFIDAIGGNDENPPSLPLKTVAEWCRRVRSMTDFVQYILILQSDIPASDTFVPSGWNQNQGLNDGGGIVIFGSRFPIVGATGIVVTAANDTDPTLGANGTQASLSAGLFDFSPWLGKLAVVTSGAKTGATAAVGPAGPLGTATMGNWIGGIPAPGDTFDLVEFTSFAPELANKGSDGEIAFQNVFFPNVGGQLNLLNGPRTAFDFCRFERDFNFSDQLGGRADVTNCIFLNPPSGRIGGFFSMHGPQNIFASCTMINGSFIGQSPSTVLQSNVFFGGGIKLDSAGVVNFLTFPGQSNGVFGAPGHAVEITRGATAFPGGGGPPPARRIFYGSGSAGFGVKVLDGGVLIGTGAASVVTGGLGDVQLQLAATAIPPLVAGAAVPGVVPLVTYADLAALGGNVLNYATGSRIQT